MAQVLSRVITHFKNKASISYLEYEVELIETFDDLWNLGTGTDIVFQQPSALAKVRYLWTVDDFHIHTVKKGFFRRKKKVREVFFTNTKMETLIIEEDYFKEIMKNQNDPSRDSLIYRVIKPVVKEK